jgi:hypothetical protein
MPSDTRAVLRGVGALGATLAVFATFLPWYVFEVIIPVPGFTHVFAVATSLWGVTTLAPILIVVSAVVALVCLSMVRARWAGVIEALIGVGITAYAVVRCFDVPALGVDLLAPGAGRATTQLGGGTFMAMAAGLALLAGSLGDLLPVRDGTATTRGTPAPGAPVGPDEERATQRPRP